MSLRSRRSKYKRGIRVYLISVKVGKVSYSKVVLYKVREEVKKRIRKGIRRKVIA
jgi:hypothetical protein